MFYKRLVLIILFSFLISCLFAQFPAPQNLQVMPGDLSVFLYWDAPETAQPVSYNVYINQSLVINTTQTQYAYVPFFVYFNQYNVTAVYENPAGESNPEECQTEVITPGMFALPCLFDFEIWLCMMGTQPQNGTSNWDVTEDGYSDYGVYFAGQNLNDSARLFTCPLILSGYNIIRVSFYYRTPFETNADQLSVIFLDEIRTIETAANWTLCELDFNSTASENILSFLAENSGGNGVFLDEINISGIVPAEDDTEPVTTEALKIFPNPVRMSETSRGSATTISFSLPESGNVAVSIYNIKGQLVKQLANEYQESGEHSLSWNGRDESERTVSEGLYFCKLSFNGRKEVAVKCLLLNE